MKNVTARLSLGHLFLLFILLYLTLLLLFIKKAFLFVVLPMLQGLRTTKLNESPL